MGKMAEIGFIGQVGGNFHVRIQTRFHMAEELQDELVVDDHRSVALFGPQMAKVRVIET